MNTKVEVIGLKEANEALRQLPELARDEAQATMNRTAFSFSHMASASAPSGDEPQPSGRGKIKAEISWAARPRSLSAVVLISKTAYHWKFQEFGTARHGAQAFLRPTAVRLAPQHREAMEKALRRGLVKIERDAARG